MGLSREYRASSTVLSQCSRFTQFRWSCRMNNLRGMSEAERFDSPRLHHINYTVINRLQML